MLTVDSQWLLKRCLGGIEMAHMNDARLISIELLAEIECATTGHMFGSERSWRAIRGMVVAAVWMAITELCRDDPIGQQEIRLRKHSTGLVCDPKVCVPGDSEFRSINGILDRHAKTHQWWMFDRHDSDIEPTDPGRHKRLERSKVKHVEIVISICQLCFDRLSYGWILDVRNIDRKRLGVAAKQSIGVAQSCGMIEMDVGNESRVRKRDIVCKKLTAEIGTKIDQEYLIGSVVSEMD